MNGRRFLVWLLLLALVLPVKLFAADSMEGCASHAATQTAHHDCCDSEQDHCADFQCSSCAGCIGGSALPVRFSESLILHAGQQFADSAISLTPSPCSELLRPPRA